MKALPLLAVFFFIAAFSACQKDNNESNKSNVIVIVDGMIKSPEWLVYTVDTVSFQSPPETDVTIYPWVFLVKHKNEEYINVVDMLNSCSYCGSLFFTLSGKPIGGYPGDSTIDLYNELFAEKDRTLLWRKE